MGNTNLPQSGAADTHNSRDTLSGPAQLAEDRKHRGIGPAPGRPADAPERIPGQLREPDAGSDVEGVTEDEQRRDREADVERPLDDDARDAGGSDIETTAVIGHANSGHSPADAT